MSNSNGHITLPINIKADLGYVLGTGNGDLGYNIVNGNINRWAKYKPVRRNIIDTTAQLNTQRTGWKDTADWWQDNDGHCGLSIEEKTALGNPFTAGQFLYLLRNEQLPWTYLRPRGAANYEWFRAFDFFHYDANADAPVGAIGATDIWLDNNYGGQIDYDTPAASEYALNINNFKLNNTAITGNFYLGVLLWRSGGTFYYLTSDTKIAAGQSISIPFTAAQSLVGSWKAVPFISSKAYTINSQTAQSGIYASCFGLGNTDIVLHAPGTIVDFDVLAVWNATNTAVTYEVVITNHGSSSQTLSGVAMEIRTTTSGSQDPASGSLVTTVNLGTVTVAGNSTITVPSPAGSVAVTRDNDLIYWVKGYATNFTNAPYNQIEDNPDI